MKALAFSKPLVLSAVFALFLALLVFYSARDADPAHATTFNVQTFYSLCTIPFDPDTDSGSGAGAIKGCSYSPSTPYNQGSTFEIFPPDVNFDSNITFSPINFDITQGSTMPTGAVLGQLKSATRLGILNGPCNQPIPGGINFTFQNASTDMSLGNQISPNPAGFPNRFLPLRQDANGNGIPDGVDKVPDYIAAMSDPDFFNVGPDGVLGTGDDNNGPVAPVSPWVRLVGSRNVAGESIVLQFLVYQPGTLTQWSALQTAFPSTGVHHFTQFSSYYGWPSVTSLVTPHPFDTKGSPSSITDFCTPLSLAANLFPLTVDNACTTTPPIVFTPDVNGTTDCDLDSLCDGGTGEGVCPELPSLLSPPTTTPDEGGLVRALTAPSNTGLLGTDTHLYIVASASHRDADNDGIENGLDPCQFDVDTWDPRLSGAQALDADNDGIPNTCDAGGAGNDEDGDNFANRQDNCATISNGTTDPFPGIGFNNEGELLQAWPADGGFRHDAIGDACDPSPLTVNGHYHVDIDIAPVCLSPSTAASIPANGLSINLSGTTDFLPPKLVAATPTSIVDEVPSTSPFPGGDALAGATLTMTSGPANGQFRTIIGSTLETVTVSPAFSPAPTAAGGDSYTISHPGDPRATWCDSTLALLSGSNTPPEHLALHMALQKMDGPGLATPISPATASPAQACNDGVDNDGDGNPDAADSACAGTADLDGDGFTEAQELATGTSPFYDCGIGGFPPNTFEADNVIDISDLGAVVNAGLFSSAAGKWRFNVFSGDTVIDISDLGAVVNAGLFTSC